MTCAGESFDGATTDDLIRRRISLMSNCCLAMAMLMLPMLAFFLYRCIARSPGSGRQGRKWDRLRFCGSWEARCVGAADAEEVVMGSELSQRGGARIEAAISGADGSWGLSDGAGRWLRGEQGVLQHDACVRDGREVAPWSVVVEELAGVQPAVGRRGRRGHVTGPVQVPSSIGDVVHERAVYLYWTQKLTGHTLTNRQTPSLLGRQPCSTARIRSASFCPNTVADRLAALLLRQSPASQTTHPGS